MFFALGINSKKGLDTSVRTYSSFIIVAIFITLALTYLLLSTTIYMSNNQLLKMKSTKLILAICILGMSFTSCKQDAEVQTTVVDFENVSLNADSISGGSSFISGNSTFTLNDGAFWNGGIVCSSKNDTLKAGYLNEYSVMAGSGAFNSKQFGVVYSPGSFTCPANGNGSYSIKSIMVTNSTYAYLDMKNGTPFVSKVFTTGDWFKVIIKGFKNKNQTNSVDVYLADFRNGKSEILKSWEKVDLSLLGQVDSVAFNFDSSDKGTFGVNTPSYVCIDNIEFTQSVSTK